MTSKTAAWWWQGLGRDAELLLVVPGISPGRHRLWRGPGAAVGAVTAAPARSSGLPRRSRRAGGGGARRLRRDGLGGGGERLPRPAGKSEDRPHRPLVGTAGPPSPRHRPPPPPPSRSGSLCKPEAAFSQPGAFRVHDAGSGAGSDGVNARPGARGSPVAPGQRGWPGGVRGGVPRVRSSGAVPSRPAAGGVRGAAGLGARRARVGAAAAPGRRCPRGVGVRGWVLPGGAGAATFLRLAAEPRRGEGQASQSQVKRGPDTSVV